MQPGMTPTVRAEVTSAITTSNTSADIALMEAVLVELQQRLGAKRFGLWFDGKIRLSVVNEHLTVAVGSPFLLNWMQRQFRPDLTGAAQAVLGPAAQVTFTVDATLAVVRPVSSATQTPQPTSRDAVGKGTDSQTVVVPAHNVVAGPSTHVPPARGEPPHQGTAGRRCPNARIVAPPAPEPPAPLPLAARSADEALPRMMRHCSRAPGREQGSARLS